MGYPESRLRLHLRNEASNISMIPPKHTHSRRKIEKPINRHGIRPKESNSVRRMRDPSEESEARQDEREDDSDGMHPDERECDSDGVHSEEGEHDSDGGQSQKEVIVNGFSLISQQIRMMQNQLSEVLQGQKAQEEKLLAIERSYVRFTVNARKFLECVNGEGEDLMNISSRPKGSSTSQSGLVPALPSSVEQSNDVPDYEMNQSIITVDRAWEEWDQGLVIGQDGLRSPSISRLEEEFGTKWRKGDRRRKRFTRRKILIDRIKKAALILHEPPNVTAHRIELWRKSNSYSLTKIQKVLQADKEPWGRNDRDLAQIDEDRIN